MLFEAIYCDPQTYQHIKMQASVDESNLDDTYLVHTRNFILDEVEADIVYLQNKTIGKNHIQWDPNYRYKAWYKAYDQIVFSKDQSPKTDPGPFIIEKTGDITVYAGEQIIMKPGFHSQSGSTYHAFIKSPPCTSSGMSQNSNNNDRKAGENHAIKFVKINAKEVEKVEDHKVKIYPNPNNGTFTLEVTEHYIGSEFMIYDTFGKKLHQKTIVNNKTQINQALDGGVYFATLLKRNYKHTEKIIIR